jgi:hypothetical protein
LLNVNKKRIQQARQVVTEAFREAGAPIDDVAFDFAREVAQDPRFLQFVNRPELVTMAAVGAGCLQVAMENIEIPAVQWSKFLENMKQHLPYDLRPGFRSGMKDVIKALPKRPSTGRNRILTEEEQRKACNLVSKYYRDGDSKRMAYAKVARQLDCSARTIQRAWTKRAQLFAKKN